MEEKIRRDVPGMVDLREDLNAPINTDEKHNERMRKRVGAGMKLSDGFKLCWVGGDFFLISRIGDIKLLLCWELHQHGRRRWVKLIRYIHVDEGILDQIGKQRREI